MGDSTSEDIFSEIIEFFKKYTGKNSGEKEDE